MRLAPAVLAMVAAGVLVGCSTSDPGQPVPTSDRTTTPSADGGPTTTAPTTTSPESGAPPVADPLETAEFQADPCTSLTDSQVNDLGVGLPGEAGSAADGKSCIWKNQNGGSIHVLWSDTVGLDGVYAAKERGDLKFFEPVADIDGLPAVVANRADRRDDGDCSVHVGTSDKVRFTLALSQSRDKVGTVDPCSVAADVAAKVVATIKGA